MANTQDELVQLEVLLRARVIAKREEDEKIERRRECDKAILALLPKMSATTRVGDIKVVTGYGVTRKVDADKLKADALAQTLPPSIASIFRWKAEVDEKAFKALSPEAKVLSAPYVTTTDASPSLKLELA